MRQVGYLNDRIDAKCLSSINNCQYCEYAIRWNYKYIITNESSCLVIYKNNCYFFVSLKWVMCFYVLFSILLHISGRLIGHFYNDKGDKTEALKDFYRRLKLAKKDQLSDKDDKNRFPTCNFEYRQGEGRRSWCSTLR